MAAFGVDGQGSTNAITLALQVFKRAVSWRKLEVGVAMRSVLVCTLFIQQTLCNCYRWGKLDHVSAFPLHETVMRIKFDIPSILYLVVGSHFFVTLICSLILL